MQVPHDCSEDPTLWRPPATSALLFITSKPYLFGHHEPLAPPHLLAREGPFCLSDKEIIAKNTFYSNALYLLLNVQHKFIDKGIDYSYNSVTLFAERSA
jgi:hypothetical protein